MRANGSVAVDTNAVIAYRAGTPEVCELILDAAGVVMPVAVLGELLYGAASSARPAENRAAVHRFAAQCVVVPADEAIAARYAEVRSELRKAERPLPENDIWIAATCLELGLPLVTRDAHFGHVAGLTILNWASPAPGT